MANSILLLIIGGFITYIVHNLLKERGRVIYYLQHYSNFQITIPPPIDDKGVPVGNSRKLPSFGCTVFIENQGNKTAKNIQIIHEFAPVNYLVIPKTKFYKEDRPLQGGLIIVLDDLTPKEVISISYIEFDEKFIRASLPIVKTESGYAKMQSVRLFPVYSKWVYKTLHVLLVLGIIFLIKICVDLAPYASVFFQKLFDIIFK